MSIERRLGLMVFVPMLCLAAFSAAQQQTPPTPGAPSTIDLDVVVTPKSGPPVADLQQQDFTVLDNKTPRQITSFHAVGGSQAPIHVIIVIDAVNVPYQSVAYTRGEIDKFLHANGGQLAYPTQLAFFVDKGMQIQGAFSTDGNELSTSLNQYAVGLREIHRSSQWEGRDLFQLSINALISLVDSESKLPGRKMILWVSPGWPLLSGPGVRIDNKQQNQIFSLIVQLSTQMREGGMTLYNVNPIGASEGVGRTFYYQDFLKGISKPGQVALGDLSLQVIATQSGGLALFGSNDIGSFLQQCVADGKAYYELSFEPPTADHRDEYHHIEVRVAKPGLTVRTRDGYYLQP